MPAFLNVSGMEVPEKLTPFKHLAQLDNLDDAKYYFDHPENPMEYYFYAKFNDDVIDLM